MKKIILLFLLLVTFSIAKEENYYIVDKNISYKQWLKEYVNK